MIYTSGTTGRPKGAVHTHGSVAAMVDGMVAAWAWSPDDRTLLVLPLNHVHGLVNVTLHRAGRRGVLRGAGRRSTPPTSGSAWRRASSRCSWPCRRCTPGSSRRGSRPTTRPRRRWSAGAAGLRLMVCGSAALPVSTLDRWRRAHRPHAARALRDDRARDGAVEHAHDAGCPATSASRCPASRCASSTTRGADVADGEPGELLVRGPQVFAGYWGRPEATAEAFIDGWFRTGDVAVHEPGGFRLLGRSSVDIIKTGGEKVSALEIEEVYRTHPGGRRLRRRRPPRRGVGPARRARRSSCASGAAIDGDDAAGVGQAAARRGEGAVALRVRRRPAPQHARQGRQGRRRHALHALSGRDPLRHGSARRVSTRGDSQSPHPSAAQHSDGTWPGASLVRWRACRSPRSPTRSTGPPRSSRSTGPSASTRSPARCRTR